MAIRLYVNGLHNPCYLLSFLSKYAFIEFDNWFKNTKRDDLKVLFISGACYHDHLFNFKDSKYEVSINPCFKAAHIITEYPLSRYVSYTKRKINEINASKLSDKEKLYGFLYYLIESYRGNEAKEFDENKVLEEELKELSNQSYFASLNADILEEFNINVHNYEIVRRIITLINDTKVKEELLVYLFNKIIGMLDTMQDPTSFTSYDLMVANTFGRILKELNTDYFDKILERFEKSYYSVILPYSFYKKHNLWLINMPRLIFYLIAIYIYEYPKTDILKSCISKYNEVKNNLPHFLDKYFEDILEQIIK